MILNFIPFVNTICLIAFVLIWIAESIPDNISIKLARKFYFLNKEEKAVAKNNKMFVGRVE